MLSRTVALLAFALAHAASGHEPAPAGAMTRSVPAAARDAAATIDAFHAALRRGDTKAAANLLTEDVLIFEAGGAERSKAEYAAHHLLADMEFSRSVQSSVTRRAGGADGSLAWVASEGRTTGSFRGKAIDRKTAETMLLRRVGGLWKITHIHWSSAPATAAAAATATPLLAGSVPANGAQVEGPLTSLELHFSPPARLLEVSISGPDGKIPMMVTAAGEQPHYTLPLPDLRRGAYTVDWRATAGGREDRGSFGFTIR